MQHHQAKIQFEDGQPRPPYSPDATTLVIYHANCPDGFAAAWAVYLAKGDKLFDYMPCAYGKEPNWDKVVEHYLDVLIVDFSFPRETLEALHDRIREKRVQLGMVTVGGSCLVVLDHHKTAQADLEGLPWATFDMNRSGAGLAWDTYHMRQEWGDRRRETAHTIVKAIQDRDLWRFELPYTKEICAAMAAQPRTFEAWDYVARKYSVEDLVSGGRWIKMEQERQIEIAMESARPCQLLGHPAICFNGTNRGPIVSETCHRLLDKHDIDIAMYWMDLEQKPSAPIRRKWGLRSRSGSDVDVAEVAKRLGGGGHKHAAGYTTKPGRMF